MRQSRREFVTSAAVATAAAAMPAIAAESPRLRLGVISDIHLRGMSNADTYEKTLRWFDSCKVDAVLLCGDIADYGLESQLKAAADVWFKVFPGDRRSDGAPVARLFHYGDHDTGIARRVQDKYRADHPEFANDRDIASGDRKAIWEKVFREPWNPIEIKDVKGYKFVLYHFINSPDSSAYAKPWGGHAEGLDRFLAAHAAELKGDKPFFYSQHRIMKDTAGGPLASGQDDGFSTKVLSEFPNCFAFCGHGHHMVTDETMIWQGSFTAVEVPALSYPCQRPGRENGFSTRDLAWYFPEKTTPVKQMPIMYVGSEGKGYARAALLVDVFADRIVLGRRDAMNDKWLGPDWVVPLPLLEKKPYDHAYRAAHDLAPAFPAGAKATVAERRGTDRAKNPVDQYVVSFPPAKSSGGRPRAYDYEVQATVFKGDVDCIVGTKRVYSPGIVKAEADEPEAVECVFAKDAITNNRDKLEFAVRPVNAFGRKGEAIKCSVA